MQGQSPLSSYQLWNSTRCGSCWHALASSAARSRRTLHLRSASAPKESPKISTDSVSIQAENKVIIAGAGIAGLATAAALQKVGIPAVILERDSGPRLEGSAIGLWPNAFRALDALGVASPLRNTHTLLQRVELCSPSGKTLRQFHLDECNGAPHEFRGVLRSSLLETLQNSLPKDCISYNSAIASVDSASGDPVINLEDGRTVKGRVLVGADGARSKVAAALKLATPTYAGYAAYRGVAEFQGMLPVAADTVRQIVGQGVRAGMYPLSANSMYWFIAMTCSAESAPSPAQYKEDALQLVKGWHHGITQAVQNTPDASITRNRITDRWLLPTKPFGSGQVTLAGDAAHPMTPNLGQGGCTALEDAVVLAQVLRDTLSKSSSSIEGLSADVLQKALREYEQRRVLRVTKITVRSNLMGRILGSSFPPVCAARDLVIEKILPIKSFMGHTLYDCGAL